LGDQSESKFEVAYACTIKTVDLFGRKTAGAGIIIFSLPITLLVFQEALRAYICVYSECISRCLFSTPTINHFIYGKNVYSRLLKRRSPRERAALTSRGFGFNAKLAARTKTVGSQKYMGKITCFLSLAAHSLLTLLAVYEQPLAAYLCTFLGTVAL
jgi:hypothetical protein